MYCWNVENDEENDGKLSDFASENGNVGLQLAVVSNHNALNKANTKVLNRFFVESVDIIIW